MQRAPTKQDVRLVFALPVLEPDAARPQRATEFAKKRKALNDQFTRRALAAPAWLCTEPPAHASARTAG
jgi:hypothetical protein